MAVKKKHPKDFKSRFVVEVRLGIMEGKTLIQAILDAKIVSGARMGSSEVSAIHNASEYWRLYGQLSAGQNGQEWKSTKGKKAMKIFTDWAAS